MPRYSLLVLRFCLSAWVAVALFFVLLVIDLRQSDLFSPETKFDHPKVLFPLYYRFEIALLGPAVLCAVAAQWHEQLGRARRLSLLQLVIVAAAFAAWDYALIYPRLVQLMQPGVSPLPPEFHALHRLSRHLNEAVVGASAVAAVLALLPENTPVPAAREAV